MGIDLQRPPKTQSQAIRQVEQQFSQMRRERPQVVSLRWQVLMMLLVVLLVTIGLVAVVVIKITRHNLKTEHLQTSLALTQLVATQASSYFDPEATAKARSDKRLQNLLDVAAAYPEVHEVVLVDRTHRFLVTSLRDSEPVAWPSRLISDALRSGKTQHTASQTPSGERCLWVVTPVGPEAGSPAAVIGLQISMARIDAHVAVTQNVLLFYLGLDALLMFIAGYLILTRVIIKPVQAIVAAVRKVGAGNYTEPIRVRNANELGMLASEFNFMVTQLKNGRQQLESKVGELEEAYNALAITQQSLVRSEKLATVGQLAAGVAHEVGNPLAAALGYLELLREGDLDPETTADLLRRTEDATTRIDRTIRELLDYSRAESIDNAPHSVREVVESSIYLVEAQPRFRDVVIVTDLPRNLPAVMLNEGKMQQVLVNLLLNAADAMEGRSPATISISAVHDERESAVKLVLRDTGEGIAPGALALIFEPFYTTKDPGQGTGLGLAICQSIVEAFGGSLQVSSTLGEGTAFSIVLPASPKLGDA